MIQFLFRQFVHFVSNFTELLELGYRSLLRWKPNEAGGGSLLRNVLLFPVRFLAGVIAFGGWLIMFPFHAATTFQDERRRDFLCGVPAGLAAIFAIVVPIFVLLRHDAVNGKYRGEALVAIKNRDFETAKIFLGRIVNQEHNVRPRDNYYWALVMANTGQTARATQIMDRLAPDDSPGFAQAHRFKALNYSVNAQRNKDPEFLRKLRFHLDHAGDNDSPEINQAWALYLVAVGQFEQAVKHLQVAANLDPKFYLSIADIYKSLENENGRQRNLKRAEDVFVEQLEKDPLDLDARILLANVLAQQTRYEEAEQILLTGLSLQPDPRMRRAGADFFVMRYDLANQSKAPFATKMDYLRRAISFEEAYLPIYNRLMDQYQQVGSRKEADEVKSMVQESIVSGKSTAFGHFVLGNILWIEGEKEEATWHIEKAYQTDGKLITVANNFAWVLAHQENPDLDRALDIITNVVKQVPNDPRFLDTYGTVLAMLRRDEEAIAPLERALGGVRNKLPVHQKLEQVYRRLGKDQIARMHRVEARKLMEQSE